MKYSNWWWSGLILVLCACQNSGGEVPTLEPIVLPSLVINAETPTALPPTLAAELPTTEPVLATLTPEATVELPTEIPPTLAPPSQPTSTPYPVEIFLNDQWVQIDPPDILTTPLIGNWIAFVNYDTPRTVAATTTPDPNQFLQTLYLILPETRQRVEVAKIPVSAGDRIFWSPIGTHIAYFVEESTDLSGLPIGGLYMLDFTIGLNYRLFGMKNLSPRGIAGHVPVWSADGRWLAMVLPTEYATDIFIVNADGTNFRNLTNSPSYELYPAFSPDGAWLAFVSDRNQCPTWTPAEPQTCDSPNILPPTQGNLFLLNLNTGALRQITDVQLNGAPRWINNSKLAFSTGGGNALAETSDLWLVDVEAGSAVQISPAGTLSFSESWSDDAGRVIYQRAGENTELVIADSVGREIATNTEYIFPRYGIAADWSADGEFIAIGGRNGRCPYGIWVVKPNFEIVTSPARNLLACDPIYAPQTNYLAFLGLQPGLNTDGRVDVYVANINGLGASNLTSTLRGQKRLLGWVGIPEE